ncbi:protein CUSTOS [Nerophis ophidion]|uniref:protein CUSTOS n=1 Tax=Nerophis ophidion TaxID=159077 RepID=UPI002AE06D07|nr:protein CUSTOS [Nerophis ophidion]
MRTTLPTIPSCKQEAGYSAMAGKAAAMVSSAVRDSSSSDDEQLKRCQEATWDTQNIRTDTGRAKQSKRVVIAAHEHDGNELQVTQGFQTHVAKKLGQLLDSHFSEIQTEIPDTMPANGDDNEEGFRLFSTSVPGQLADDPPPPVRRRPIPSSSDSDSEMEMRLKEAAVSFHDLLPSSSTAEPPYSEKIKKCDREDNLVKKKKKKRLVEDAGSTQVNCDVSACVQSSRELAKTQQKQHKDKRKNRKQHNALTEDLE